MINDYIKNHFRNHSIAQSQFSFGMILIAGNYKHIIAQGLLLSLSVSLCLSLLLGKNYFQTLQAQNTQKLNHQ